MKPKLEIITQEEFELHLAELLLHAKKAFNEVVEAYNKYYMIDRDNYQITYSKHGNEYRYEKGKIKRKIGFKQDG
jgi:hypothetical protein